MGRRYHGCQITGQDQGEGEALSQGSCTEVVRVSSIEGALYLLLYFPFETMSVPPIIIYKSSSTLYHSGLSVDMLFVRTFVASIFLLSMFIQTSLRSSTIAALFVCFECLAYKVGDM